LEGNVETYEFTQFVGVVAGKKTRLDPEKLSTRYKVSCRSHSEIFELYKHHNLHFSAAAAAAAAIYHVTLLTLLVHVQIQIVYFSTNEI
jgi:hypothetical protein